VPAFTGDDDEVFFSYYFCFKEGELGHLLLHWLPFAVPAV